MAVTAVAVLVVVLFGLWLIGLASLMVLAPDHAEAFLGKFASSARAHYLEQSLRLLAGTAMVLAAPALRFSQVFRVFGWIVIVTGLALVVLPWRWHRRFGEWVIPLAIRHLRLHALGAFALGAFVLYAALGG